MVIPFVGAETNTSAASDSVKAEDLKVTFPGITQPEVDIELEPLNVSFEPIPAVDVNITIPKVTT